MGGLFVLKTSICASDVVHLHVIGLLYLDCPLMEVLLYNVSLFSR